MAKLSAPWERLLSTTDLPLLVPGLKAALEQGPALDLHVRLELVREIEPYWVGDEIPDFFSSGLDA